MEVYRHKVQVYETDNMGITHHSNYVRFMEEARVDFLEKLGYGYEKMMAKGLSSPVVSINVDYKYPTTYPQIIEIEVKVVAMTPLKLKLGYVMKCEDKVVCLAESTHCFLQENKKPVVLGECYPEIHKIFADLLQ